MPENRHGIPSRFSDRRTGSAAALVRTRIATSRGRAPAAMRRAMSEAIQSASSDPVANASWRTAAAPSVPRSATSRFTMPARTSSRSGSLWRTSRYDASRIGSARAVVAAQDDDPGVPVALPELEDVADRGAAELVDRLVVVAHDRHVAVRLGEQRDQLRLRAVRVLELVHEHVPEARLDALARRRRLAQQPQRERRPGRRSRSRRSPPAGPGTSRRPGPAPRAGPPPPAGRPRPRRPARPRPAPGGRARGRGTPPARRPRPSPARTATRARPGTASGCRAAGTRPARARTGAPRGTRPSRAATAPGRPSAGRAPGRAPGSAGRRRRGTWRSRCPCSRTGPAGPRGPASRPRPGP